MISTHMQRKKHSSIIVISKDGQRPLQQSFKTKIEHKSHKKKNIETTSIN